MKKLFIFLVILMFISCEQYVPSSPKEIVEGMTYFKDGRTGLCYSVIRSLSADNYAVTSFTCVPCDSLKKFQIPVYGK